MNSPKTRPGRPTAKQASQLFREHSQDISQMTTWPSAKPITLTEEPLRVSTGPREDNLAWQLSRSEETIEGVHGLLQQVPNKGDRADALVLPAASVWAMRYHQTRRQLTRVLWGFGALVLVLLGLVVALVLGGVR